MKYLFGLAACLTITAGCGVSHSELAALQKQVDDLRADLAIANAKLERFEPVARKVRALPIFINHRPATVASGRVYKFTNTANEPVLIRIQFSNPAQKQFTTGLLLQANETREIGSLEGWNGKPGDEIEVTATNFDPLNKKFD